MNNPFKFTNDFSKLQDKESFVAIVASVRGKQELLEELNHKLKFPDYFGYNWDALDVCIKNLNGLRKKIILIHENLPSLNKKN